MMLVCVSGTVSYITMESEVPTASGMFSMLCYTGTILTTYTETSSKAKPEVGMQGGKKGKGVKAD